MTLAAAALAVLAQCAAVDDPAARLACYDALAGRAPQPAATPAAPSAAPQAPAAAPAPVPAPAVTPPPLGRSYDDFGKPKPPATGTNGVLSARIVGTFREWKKGTRFTLDNGQVWQVVSDDSGYYPSVPENPEVTIEEVLFGYRMEIVAVSRRLKVKRVS